MFSNKMLHPIYYSALFFVVPLGSPRNPEWVGVPKGAWKDNAKITLKKQFGRAVTGFIWGHVFGYCKYSNKISGSIKFWKNLPLLGK
jgi:hypothetical protein